MSERSASRTLGHKSFNHWQLNVYGFLFCVCVCQVTGFGAICSNVFVLLVDTYVAPERSFATSGATKTFNAYLLSNSYYIQKSAARHVEAVAKYAVSFVSIARNLHQYIFRGTLCDSNNILQHTVVAT